MTIPGHAPRPRHTSDASRRHTPFHRDAGLERIAQATKWTLAGGIVLTGGFSIAAASAEAPKATTHTTATSDEFSQDEAELPTVPDAAVSATAPATAPPSTVVVGRPGGRTSRRSARHSTTTPVTAPPATSTPDTVPPQPPYVPPVRTHHRPVITSGGS